MHSATPRPPVAVLRFLILIGLSTSGLGCERSPSDEQLKARGFALVSRDPDAALRVFGQVRDPNDLRTRFGMALAHEAKKDFARAVQTLEQARALAPEQADIRVALARNHVLLGKLDHARTEAQHAHRLAPTTLAPALWLGILAVTPEHHTAARAAFQRITGAPGAVAPTAEQLLVEAAGQRALGHPQAAQALLMRAQQAPLGTAVDAMLLASVAHRQGKAPLCRLLLSKVVATGNASHMVPAARLALQVPDLATAGIALGKIPERPERLEVRLLRGRHALADGRYETALQHFQQARELDGDGRMTTALDLWSAEAHLLDGAPDAAVALLQPLVDAQPPHPKARPLLARALVMRGEHAGAVALLQAALSAAPGDLQLLRALAMAHLAAEQLPEARIALSQHASTVRDQVMLGLLRAEVLEQGGDPRAAGETLVELTRRHPKRASAFVALARWATAHGTLAQAIGAQQAACGLQPESTRLLAELAALQHRSGDATGAMATYERVLELQPDHVLALNNAAMLMLQGGGGAARAVTLAERARKLSPGNPGVADTLGWALYRRGAAGDVERALSLLDEARRGRPTANVQGRYATVRDHLAQLAQAD